MLTRWLFTVLIQLDELANAVLGGYAHETISKRMAIKARAGNRLGCLFCTVVQVIVPDHCNLAKPSKAMFLLRPKK